MPAPLLPTRFLFRFSAACRYRDPLWTAEGAKLDESYRLPNLAELEENTPWADVRAAWSEQGLAFCVHVLGKSQALRHTSAKIEDCDGLQIWIDTRDVHNVHRAGRFCHRFIFLPEPKAAAPSRPRPFFPPIPRVFRSIGPRNCRIRFDRTCCRPAAGCSRTDIFLEALIPAEALTGFDTAEHPRLGFNYAVIDRELGEQTFGVGSPMPYQEDPSLWATLELTK